MRYPIPAWSAASDIPAATHCWRTYRPTGLDPAATPRSGCPVAGAAPQAFGRFAAWAAPAAATLPAMTPSCKARVHQASKSAAGLRLATSRARDHGAKRRRAPMSSARTSWCGPGRDRAAGSAAARCSRYRRRTASRTMLPVRASAGRARSQAPPFRRHSIRDGDGTRPLPHAWQIPRSAGAS